MEIGSPLGVLHTIVPGLITRAEPLGDPETFDFSTEGASTHWLGELDIALVMGSAVVLPIFCLEDGISQVRKGGESGLESLGMKDGVVGGETDISGTPVEGGGAGGRRVGRMRRTRGLRGRLGGPGGRLGGLGGGVFPRW